MMQDLGKKIELELFCQLTEDEMRSRALMLAETVHTIDDVQSARNATAKEFRERLTGLMETQRKLSRILHDSAEKRLVVCRAFFHIPMQGTKRTVRVDTGEVVSEEAMTPAELQLNIFASQQEFEKFLRGQDVEERPDDDAPPADPDKPRPPDPG
jgi:hypothetical protein